MIADVLIRIRTDQAKRIEGMKTSKAVHNWEVIEYLLDIAARYTRLQEIKRQDRLNQSKPIHDPILYKLINMLNDKQLAEFHYWYYSTDAQGMDTYTSDQTDLILEGRRKYG